MTVAPSQIKPQRVDGVSRDVQDELAKQRADKRRQAGGASPVQFHKDLIVGDDWNCEFIKKISCGVSMHGFAIPPDNVLDLGCGSGLWIIEAAKSWPNSHFVGFDLRSVQPDLSQVNLGIEYRDLSKRIQWVIGDFLDPLPFDANQFDLVRICCIGLEVPEDSWQELLEECARVLKPGAVLEVIEEDLLFPAGRTRKPMPERNSNLRTVTIRRTPSGERNRSDSTASKWTTATNQSQSSTSTSSMVFTTERISQSASMESSPSSSSSRADSSQDLFLQDHEKLKDAWEEMLGQRFLTHKLLTVLPFYVSSLFSNVYVHPTLTILLPPPSWHRGSDPLSELETDLEAEAHARWLEDMRSGAVQLNGDSTSRKAHAAALRARPPAATVTRWNKLHLARQVRLVTACKEAIWQAYRSLESGGFSPLVEAVPRDELRDEFERAWEAWEEDMKDRMGVRNQMRTLDWKDPDAYSLRPGSFRSSTSNAQSKRRRASSATEADLDNAAVCRAMRGLTARKPVE
ncbi:hypothetical protein C8Q80DRAFT_649111 [Daedaleopsis nitida]|nr:hypothetical protein C8Q80DRAFT_649111 [Daedaleopsis nitida]